MKLDKIQNSSYKLCDFCSLLGFKIVLQNRKRLILRSPDNQYIIKIFSDVSDGQVKYLREKLYYQLFSPYEFPHIVYSDDENEIIITEDLEASGLISQFEFLQETDCKERLLTGINSSAKGLAKIHQQTYNGFFNMFSNNETVETYEEFEHSTIENHIQTLQSDGYENSVPSIECFEKKSDNIEKPIMVLNHGDYIPWNLFVESETGELKAVIDGEWMSVAPLTFDFAKAIRGLIDARKNNPTLIRNIYDIIEIFVESYISLVKEDRSKITVSMPYYLGYAFLDAAFIASTKWQSDLWTRWHLELANYFLNVEKLDLDAILEPFSVNSQPIDVEWVGNLTPPTGSETTITSGEDLKVYVSAYVKGEANRLSPVVGSNIAAQVWSNIHSEWESFPMEFVGYEGNNYRFGGNLSPEKKGEYEFTARISGDGGKTWKWASERKQNAILISKA